MFKKNKNSQAPPISGRVLLTLPYVYVYPDELLEGLCIAISCDSLKFVSLSTNDINLYSLHRKDNSFIASCYAVKYGDLYYGNIIGSKDIFSFLPDDFIIKQTSELLAPLKIDSNAYYYLVCTLDKENIELHAKLIKKVLKSDPSEEEILYTFVDEVYFEEAINIAEKQLP